MHSIAFIYIHAGNGATAALCVGRNVISVNKDDTAVRCSLLRATTATSTESIEETVEETEEHNNST